MYHSTCLTALEYYKDHLKTLPPTCTYIAYACENHKRILRIMFENAQYITKNYAKKESWQFITSSDFN